MFRLEGYIYLAAGLIILCLSLMRRRTLSKLEHNLIPELDWEEFTTLKSLLETSHDRAIALGISFLALAYVTISGAGGTGTKILFMILTIGVFLSNIPPRNKIMAILISSGIDPKVIRDRGIRL